MRAWSLAWNTAWVPLASPSLQVLQIRRTGKGCLSYLVSDGTTALVIDPSLDAPIYQELASQHGWQITSVFETHLHADHLSRARQLATQTGAMLFLPPETSVSFPTTRISDGDTLDMGSLGIRAIATPGHTRESTCYLVNDQVLFTGDTLFLTSVGRPDLDATPTEALHRSEALYHSLHKVLALPASTLVLPGHTSAPDPFDGVALQSTLGHLDEHLPLLHLPRALFVQEILARIPPAPPNAEQIVQFNALGRLPEGESVELEAGANRCAIA